MADRADWEDVLTTLVASRGDALVRYAFLLCGNADDARDLVQTGLEKTFGRLRNGFELEKAEAYVRRAIASVYLDRGRRLTRWRRQAHLHVAEESTPPATGQVDARLDMQRHLRALSPRERACVVLRYYDDRKVDEIAQELGISSGSVKRYLSDGLAKLASALDDARREQHVRS